MKKLLERSNGIKAERKGLSDLMDFNGVHSDCAGYINTNIKLQGYMKRYTYQFNAETYE